VVPVIEIADRQKRGRKILTFSLSRRTVYLLISRNVFRTPESLCIQMTCLGM